MDAAAVLGDALTDYVLATGTKRASATQAPEHMARWLEAHGYRIVPDLTQGSSAGSRRQCGHIVRRSRY
jgi:hypothetical protein